MLSTCNRVEVYADTEGFHAGRRRDHRPAGPARRACRSTSSRTHLYVHWEGQAVQHLFQVACGLDSMVVGESQILGQLRRAYAASAQRAPGRTLHELFQKALRVGKRAHSRDRHRRGRPLARHASGSTARSRPSARSRAGSVLVVGAGSMGALAGATLRRAGVGEHHRRQPHRRERRAPGHLARGHAASGSTASRTALVRADVVVSSTGATGVVVDARPGRAGPSRPAAAARSPSSTWRCPATSTRRCASCPASRWSTSSRCSEVLATTDAGRRRRGRPRRSSPRRSAPSSPGSAPRRVAPDGRRAAQPRRRGRRGRARPARPAGCPTSTSAPAPRSQPAVRRVVDTLLHTPTVRVKELAEAPAGALVRRGAARAVRPRPRRPRGRRRRARLGARRGDRADRGARERPLRLGTRGSALALTQSGHVADALRARSASQVELVTVTDRGRRRRAPPSPSSAAPASSSPRCATRCCAGEVDLAVHSYKDLPTAPADGPGHRRRAAARGPARRARRPRRPHPRRAAAPAPGSAPARPAATAQLRAPRPGPRRRADPRQRRHPDRLRARRRARRRRARPRRPGPARPARRGHRGARPAAGAARARAGRARRRVPRRRRRRSSRCSPRSTTPTPARPSPPSGRCSARSRPAAPRRSARSPRSPRATTAPRSTCAAWWPPSTAATSVRLSATGPTSDAPGSGRRLAAELLDLGAADLMGART